jgi:hypothetical protein
VAAPLVDAPLVAAPLVAASLVDVSPLDALPLVGAPPLPLPVELSPVGPGSTLAVEPLAVPVAPPAPLPPLRPVTSSAHAEAIAGAARKGTTLRILFHVIETPFRVLEGEWPVLPEHISIYASPSS